MAKKSKSSKEAATINARDEDAEYEAWRAARAIDDAKYPQYRAALEAASAELYKVRQAFPIPDEMTDKSLAHMYRCKKAFDDLFGAISSCVDEAV